MSEDGSNTVVCLRCGEDIRFGQEVVASEHVYCQECAEYLAWEKWQEGWPANVLNYPSELLSLMKSISQKAFGEDWHNGLEYSLWRRRDEGPERYGKHVVTADECKGLYIYSQTACGWWIFDEAPVWVDMHSWHMRLRDRTARQRQGEE